MLKLCLAIFFIVNAKMLFSQVYHYKAKDSFIQLKLSDSSWSGWRKFDDKTYSDVTWDFDKNKMTWDYMNTETHTGVLVEYDVIVSALDSSIIDYGILLINFKLFAKATPKVFYDYTMAINELDNDKTFWYEINDSTKIRTYLEEVK